jgi:ribosomal protein S18 acetylase RimI-like enzyme
MSNAPVPAVWRAQQLDAAVVTRLLAEFRDWWAKEEPATERIHETVGVLLADDSTEFLLGGADRQNPDGVCQIRYRLSVWTSAPDCWLEDLYVRDRARRTGLGSALVEAAIENAAGRGCRRIELDVNEDNEAALALYRRLGFTTEPKPPGRSLFAGRTIEPG